MESLRIESSFQINSSEEEKSISPSKELEKAVEESLKNVDINGDL